MCDGQMRRFDHLNTRQDFAHFAKILPESAQLRRRGVEGRTLSYRSCVSCGEARDVVLIFSPSAW